MAARWNEGAINALKIGWAAGMPAREIAERLSRDPNLGVFTRNMVIGKAHRLGLEARPSPIVRNG